MKIAQVNTNMYGGAAVVAKRIHRALLAAGKDSTLVTKNGVNHSEPDHIFFKNARFKLYLRNKLTGSRVFPLAKYLLELRTHRNLVGRPPGFEIFSPLGNFPIPSYEVFQKQDIIHLHWTNDFFNYSHFFEVLKEKKFVWTLHDMNPFTGGCHHADGCVKFTSDCSVCPQLRNTVDDNYANIVLRSKQDALMHLKNDQLVVVSPSQWLSDLSKQSVLLGRFKHVVIPNPTFQAVTAPGDREVLKSKLGFLADKKIVLFAADNLKNPRKGLSFLFQAMNEFPQRDKVQLIGIGNGAGVSSNLDILFTGSISDPQVLANYFFISDLFVIPSVAENSPLVAIEALTCGTPVVGSKIGGIPELINSENGMVFPVGDVRALAACLQRTLFNKPFDRNRIRAAAMQAHHPESVIKKYISLYDHLAENRCIR